MRVKHVRIGIGALSGYMTEHRSWFDIRRSDLCPTTRQSSPKMELSGHLLFCWPLFLPERAERAEERRWIWSPCTIQAGLPIMPSSRAGTEGTRGAEDYDNYDSFTYNLVQYLGELGITLEVYRNDQITLEKMTQKEPKAILISPGPGRPDEAGISMAAIRTLGHQCIAWCFGGQVVKADHIMHSKTSEMIHDGKTLFQGIAPPLTVTRYHSLILERESLPPVFRISGETAAGEVMAIRHQEYPLEGIQFHPASILTPEGKKILGNFLKLIPHARQKQQHDGLDDNRNRSRR